MQKDVWLKGNLTEERKKYSVSLRFLVLFNCSKLTFENHKNTTVSAAILGTSVCVSDVINKAGICGKRIKNVMS